VEKDKLQKEESFTAVLKDVAAQASLFTFIRDGKVSIPMCYFPPLAKPSKIFLATDQKRFQPYGKFESNLAWDDSTFIVNDRQLIDVKEDGTAIVTCIDLNKVEICFEIQRPIRQSDLIVPTQAKSKKK
jgi:hypothetical protein